MSKKNFVPRVSQIDSLLLDKEIIEVLKTQVTNISKFDNGVLLSRLGPEINALLKFYVWKFSVHNSYRTFGQQMLNLKYEGNVNPNKSYLWCIFTILPLYLRERLENGYILQRKNKRSDLIVRAIQWMIVCLRLVEVFNHLMFLKYGKYPSLVERVLKMNVVFATRQNRTLGYSYMTRELIWHTLIEFLGNIIPMINYHSLRRKLNAKFSPPEKRFLRRDNVLLKPGMKCAVCKNSPILPHHIGCSHMFCFYCIQGNLLADNGFQCPLCGGTLDGTIARAVPYQQ